MKMRNPSLLASFTSLHSSSTGCLVRTMQMFIICGRLTAQDSWRREQLGLKMHHRVLDCVWVILARFGQRVELEGCLFISLYLIGKPSDIISLGRAVGWKVENFVGEAGDFVEVHFLSFICILHQSAEWDWCLKQPEALRIVSGWG